MRKIKVTATDEQGVVLDEATISVPDTTYQLDVADCSGPWEGEYEPFAELRIGIPPGKREERQGQLRRQ
jgi:hypothetical protein